MKEKDIEDVTVIEDKVVHVIAGDEIVVKEKRIIKVEKESEEVTKSEHVVEETKTAEIFQQQELVDEQVVDEEVPTLCQMAKALIDHHDEAEIEPPVPSRDFRLYESFRSHYVRDNEQSSSAVEEYLADPSQIGTEADSAALQDMLIMTKSGASSLEGSELSARMSESTGSKFDSIDEEQESGLEITAKESVTEHATSTDQLISDRTDSLLQESTLQESSLMEKTLSQQTLEADVPSDFGFQEDSPAKQIKILSTTALENAKNECQQIISSEVKEHVFTQAETVVENIVQQEALTSKEDKVMPVKELVVAEASVSTTTSPSTLMDPEKAAKEVTIPSHHEELLAEVKKSAVIQSPITETVELTPILAWELQTGGEKTKTATDTVEFTTTEVRGMEIQSLCLDSGTSHTTSSSEQRSTPPSSVDGSVCSSRMTDRSGTQSSIEIQSKSTTSTRSRSSSYVESSEDKESTTRSSQSNKSSSFVSESIHETVSSTADSSSKRSTSSSKHVRLSESSEGRTEEDDSGRQLEKSSTSQLQQETSSEVSAHSLPSSPRRLRRAHSIGVKKLTSELFSTDSDISRSLEIVYTEPEEDSRRKLSQRYRHGSSSGNSDGSITNNESGKLEKRKPSVTQLRKSPEASRSDYTRSESCSGRVSSAKTSSTESPYELQHAERKKGVTEAPMPLSGSSKPSPTKIKHPEPSSASLKEQISDEVISPVLAVESHTPQKKRQSLNTEGTMYSSGRVLLLTPFAICFTV